MDYIGYLRDFERRHGKTQSEMAELLGMKTFQNYQSLLKAKTISHDLIAVVDGIYEQENPPGVAPAVGDGRYTTTLEKLVSKYESENADLKVMLNQVLSSLAELKDTSQIIAAKALANHEVMMRCLGGDRVGFAEMSSSAHKLFFSKLETYEQSGIRSETGI